MSTMRGLVRDDGSVDIDAARAIVDRATPGRWVTYSAGATVNGTPCMTLTALRSACVHDGVWLADVRAGAPGDEETVKHNAVFIATARDLMPVLLDEVERLRKELASFKTASARAGFGSRPKF